VEIFASEPSVPYSAPHEEVNDRSPNADWFSLVDAERERLLGRPIPQYLEGKNFQTPLILHCLSVF
jgi:hypothetical protein